MHTIAATIFVVDPNLLFCAGLVSLLARGSDRHIQGVSNIQELAHEAASAPSIDLVLMQSPLPEFSGSCMVAQTRALLPDTHIAMLADKFNAAEMCKCFAAGADGYLVRDIGSDALLASIDLILLGEKIMPTPLANLLSHDSCGPVAEAQPVSCSLASISITEDVSGRELEILSCLVNGDSNKRIANKLGIAEATVKVHLKSILRKIHAANRTQAAIWAVQRGVSYLTTNVLLYVWLSDMAEISQCTWMAMCGT